MCHPKVRIVFLPPNTTLLLQAWDQGIIYNFKTYYIIRSLQWILDKTDSKSIDVKEAWKQFLIKNCTDIISLSQKELKITTLNRCWKKIWPAKFNSKTNYKITYHLIKKFTTTLDGQGNKARLRIF